MWKGYLTQSQREVFISSDPAQCAAKPYKYKESSNYGEMNPSKSFQLSGENDLRRQTWLKRGLIEWGLSERTNVLVRVETCRQAAQQPLLILVHHHSFNFFFSFALDLLVGMFERETESPLSDFDVGAFIEERERWWRGKMMELCFSTNLNRIGLSV